MEIPPLVTVIILNYNGRVSLGDEFLIRAIESVLNSNYPNLKVVFVDNGSQDGSYEFVCELFKQRKDFKAIRFEKNLGYSRGNNEAVRRLDHKPKYIVFLNNDVIVSYNWLKEAVRILESEEHIKGVKPLHLHPDGRSYSGVLFGLNARPVVIRDPLYSGVVAYVSGACLIIDAEVFEELGGFDEHYMHYYQDLDLGWNIWVRGYRLVSVPASIIFHIGGVATSSRFGEEGRAYCMIKDRCFFVFKNYPTKMLLKSLPFIIADLIADSCYHLLWTRNLGWFIGVIKGSISVLRDLKKLLTVRKKYVKRQPPSSLFSFKWLIT